MTALSLKAADQYYVADHPADRFRQIPRFSKACAIAERKVRYNFRWPQEWQASLPKRVIESSGKTKRTIIPTAPIPDSGDFQITYIRTHEGFLYLVVVIDLFSRRVIGWSMQGRT